MKRSRVAFLFLVFCGALVTAFVVAPHPAEAHGYLIRVIPENGAVLDRPPTRLQAWFSETLEARFSQFTLTNERGEAFALTDNGVLENSPTRVSARIVDPLPDGVYVAFMRIAFASDGHVYDERVTFSVGAGAVTPGGSQRDTQPLEILWRAILLPALEVLFGVTLLHQIVLLPGWGNPRFVAGGLPPRIMNRLSMAMWIALGVAFGANVLALVQQSAVLFGTDIGGVVRGSLWQTVLNGTQIGDTLKWRFALIALVAAFHFGAGEAAKRLPIMVTPLWITSNCAAALALFTISASSHSAGSDLWLLPSVGVHWLHVLATSAWVGGLVGLTLTLPVALKPLTADQRQLAAAAVLRRFSKLGVIIVILLILTGAYESALQLRQASDITQTGYGLTWIAKLALVLSMLGFALYHHLLVAEDRLTKALGSLKKRLNITKSLAIGNSLRLEALLGIVVLVAAAALAATPTPIPPNSGARPTLPTESTRVGDLDVRLTIDPGAEGDNAYEVGLVRNRIPVSGAVVTLQFALPELDQRSKPIMLDDVNDGTYLNAGPELERDGEWGVWIDIRESGSTELIRAALHWSVPDELPPATLREPTPLNWLTLFGAIGALGFSFAPALVRRVRRLGLSKLNPDSVLVGGLLFVVTIAILVGGSYMLADASRRADELRNPVPSVVNPVLADSDSLIAGRKVYEQACAACHGTTGEGGSAPTPKIRYLLDSRRDESLYQTIMHGYGAMKPVPLSERETWDVINYLRSGVFR